MSLLMSTRKLGPTGLYLADSDGTHKVYFTESATPNPIPKPTMEYGVELETMREGSGGPGFRTAQLTGTQTGWEDCEFSVLLLDAAQVTELDRKWRMQPPQEMLLSFDNGGTEYIVVFQKKGLQGKYWTTDWTREGADIKLHVLQEA